MPAPRAIPFAVLPALAQLTSAPALAQTPGAPVDLATFPRTSLEITHREHGIAAILAIVSPDANRSH